MITIINIIIPKICPLAAPPQPPPLPPPPPSKKKQSKNSHTGMYKDEPFFKARIKGFVLRQKF